MTRGASGWAAAAAVVSCAAGVAAPVRADEADRPPSFLDAGEAVAAEDAFFVRAVSLKIGGEFDSAGDEEVHVFLEIGGRAVDAGSKSFDLPSDALAELSLEDWAWVELRPADRFEIDVSVRDADVTGWEHITATPAPQAFAPDAFGRDTPARVEIAAETIRLTEWRFFGPNKEVVLRGPKIGLELLRTARRDAPDDRSRRAAKAAFGELLELGEAAAGPGLAAALGRRLPEAVGKARLVAARSTHTRVRRVLPEMAGEARALALLAARVAAADSAEIERYRRAVLDAADAADRAGAAAPSSDTAGVLTRCREVARSPRDPVGEEAVPALAERVAAVRIETSALAADARAAEAERRREGGRAAGRGARPFEELDRAVVELDAALERARAGLTQRPALEDAWGRFQARLLEEVDIK